MDEADAEEVAKTAGNKASKEASPAPPLEPTTELKEKLVEAPRAQASGADNSASSKETVSDTSNVPVITQSQQHDNMEVGEDGVSNQTAKRPRDDTEGAKGTTEDCSTV
ncbi:hypothetical protein V5799_019364 [Amblyomma americanum]|uniref:Uncharacterized protein n=1 Tax=Amblyomma americanum TaxID=6943 RepID=A0AAQ4EX57_AMBAM